jgi:ketosteroid isomerase-like protein
MPFPLPVVRATFRSCPPDTEDTMTLCRATFLTVAALWLPAVAVPAGAQIQQPDSAAVAATVRAFGQALQDGDTAAIEALLADDVMVAESGGVETREEYLAHHLPADMAFAAAVHREQRSLRVTVSGDVAWAVSTSHTTGTFRGRAIDSTGAELTVLSRERDGWRIRAVHWSSRRGG